MEVETMIEQEQGEQQGEQQEQAEPEWTVADLEDVVARLRLSADLIEAAAAFQRSCEAYGPDGPPFRLEAVPPEAAEGDPLCEIIGGAQKLLARVGL